MIGEVERGHSIRRNTGQPGDLLWVTGSPGSAAAGLAILKAHGPAGFPPAVADLVGAYLTPTARLREGRALGICGAVSSMIDLSDGLIGDIGHMIEGRQAGIVLLEESLPIGEPLGRAAALLGCTSESLILGPSDDYELIFTTSREGAESALKALHSVSDVPVWPIGYVIEDGAGTIQIENAEGNRRPPSSHGWNHFSNPGDV
jgi:thiamine-monophosphate kinase